MTTLCSLAGECLWASVSLSICEVGSARWTHSREPVFREDNEAGVRSRAGFHPNSASTLLLGVGTCSVSHPFLGLYDLISEDGRDIPSLAREGREPTLQSSWASDDVGFHSDPYRDCHTSGPWRGTLRPARKHVRKPEAQPLDSPSHARKQALAGKCAAICLISRVRPGGWT